MLIHNPVVTGSITISGSLVFEEGASVSASYAITASHADFAQTASYVETAQTASYVETAQTASYITASNIDGLNPDPFPYTGDAQINGGLDVTGSVEFSYEGAGPGAWSTGGALITGRQALAGAGTQNAGLAFGGRQDGFPFSVSCTEEYNGTSWTAGGALSEARYPLAGAGTQNAGLAFGGGYTTCTEEYDGSSWSAGGALITA